jgi:hypothetical protein
VETRVFRNDDQGYVVWTRHHPNGYVVNSWQKPKATYLLLHRANCHRITVETHGPNWTSRRYMKACSESAEQLRDWAHRETGAYPTPCKTCSPT